MIDFSYNFVRHMRMGLYLTAKPCAPVCLSSTTALLYTWTFSLSSTVTSAFVAYLLPF